MAPGVTPVPVILLCGGRGTRLSDPDGVEKPLVEVGDVPMVARVLRALADASHVGPIHAITSPETPETAALLRDQSPNSVNPDQHPDPDSRPDQHRNGPHDYLRVVEGTGDGYVADLDAALDRIGRPALSVVADLPLLAAPDVDAAVERALDGSSDGADSLAVCVPATLKRDLGVSVDTSFTHEGREVAPTGLNVVEEGSDRVWVREGADARRLAVNVNRPGDLAVADRLARD